MKPRIPDHAVWIAMGRRGGWFWETGRGWSVLVGGHEVVLENCERDGKRWHTIDWRDYATLTGQFAGGLARYEDGHMDLKEFLPLAERLFTILQERMEKSRK
ncbi:MAG TPA: hypothetical protein VHE55_01060 [Fimbriimonadaceae bacterium]|nr:hypothetical protein [Fimbriimonadaceae bacterium]